MIVPSIDYSYEVIAIHNSQAEYSRDGAMLDFFTVRCIRPKGVHEYMAHPIDRIYKNNLAVITTKLFNRGGVKKKYN